MKKVRKKALTLLEIMIVIAIISMIGGVIGFNMKKSLDKAKKFKTETARRQLEDILNLEFNITSDQQNTYLDDNGYLTETAKKVIEDSGLVRDAHAVMFDAWNEPFIVKFKDNHFEVYSRHDVPKEDQTSKATN